MPVVLFMPGGSIDAARVQPDKKRFAVYSPHALRAFIPRLADRIVDRLSAEMPEAWRPWGNSGRAKSIRDAGYHLEYLATALEADDPGLSRDYRAWAKARFAGLGFSERVLAETMTAMRAFVAERLPIESRDRVLDFIDPGVILEAVGAPGPAPAESAASASALPSSNAWSTRSLRSIRMRLFIREGSTRLPNAPVTRCRFLKPRRPRNRSSRCGRTPPAACRPFRRCGRRTSPAVPG